MTPTTRRIVCPECQFELFHYVGTVNSCPVGIYSDARFPGRLILVLPHHAEHLHTATQQDLDVFWEAVTQISRTLESIPEVTRTNVAVLGNQLPHIHAHIIPRRSTDDMPHKAPWEDTRAKEPLHPKQVELWAQWLRNQLNLQP